MWPNPQETVDLVTFTEEILNGKLYFLGSDNKPNLAQCSTRIPPEHVRKVYNLGVYIWKIGLKQINKLRARHYWTSTTNYFLIRFAETKITYFIFVNNWVIREKQKFSASRVVFSCNKLRGNKVTIFLS